MLGGLKKMIKGWLDIQEAPNTTISISEVLNFDTNCIKNEIWMRGDPNEIEQLYKNIDSHNAMFWASVPYIKIRKVHTGMPHIITEILTAIVIRDMNDIELKKRNEDWKSIEEDNDFKKILEQAVKKALYLGDGAFKISFDRALTDKPIIEFYGANEVELVYTRGRFKEAVFKTNYTHNTRKYMLYETYGYGYIKNKLVRLHEEKEVMLDSIPQTKNLSNYVFGGYKEDTKGNVAEKGKFCMAVPFKIYESTKWKDRGSSIFDGKEGAFDSLDEAFSQWMDALRSSRPTKYIPKTLLPRDDKTGYVLNPNDFDNRFIESGSGAGENDKNEIKLIQPTIPSENYLQSYMTALDACLQGLISPSTLGIDVKKLDNAEAQREKEKATLYTRNKIIEALQNVLPVLVNSTLKSWDAFNGRAVSDDDIMVTVEFGEYANPSFEATVETVVKAKTGGIMSIEAAVDELYGDSKEESWKKEEVRRLKEEQGISEMEEPYISNIDIRKGGESSGGDDTGAFVSDDKKAAKGNSEADQKDAQEK